MEAYWVLISLIAGYKFSTVWYGTRYDIARIDNYHLYFRIGFSGIVIFLLSSFSLFLLQFVLVYVPFFIINSFYPFRDCADLLDKYQKILAGGICIDNIALSSLIIISGFSGRFFNYLFLWRRDYYYRRSIMYMDIEKKIFNSVENHAMISVTLLNGEIYLGYAAVAYCVGIRKEVTIFPVISGSIKESPGFEINREHDWIGSGRMSDIFNVTTVIPLAAVATVSNFDIEIFEEEFRGNN